MECPCTTCLPFELPECAESLTIKSSFGPETDYYLHISDRNGTRNIKVTTDEDGFIVLQIKDNPDVPVAFFNPYGGFYEVRVTEENVQCNYLPFELCDGTSSDCLFLTFKKIAGEQPEAVIPCSCPE